MDAIMALTPAQMRTGNIIGRQYKVSKIQELEIVGEYTGQCRQGMHFGNSCYNFISTYFLFDRKEYEKIRKVTKKGK